MSNAPGYTKTCALIAAFVNANGIKLVPQETVLDGFGGNKGWACFQHAATLQKIYVARSSGTEPEVHTTIEVPTGTAGLKDHVRDGRDRRPGKIRSFFSSSPDTLGNLLRLWADSVEPLPAAKAPVRRAASQDAPSPASPAPATPPPTPQPGTETF